VLTLGHAVREIERSHQRVVIEETATTGAVVVLGAMAALVLIVFRNLASAYCASVFAILGVYSAVSSRFAADRDRGLILKRRVGPLTIERVYESGEIAQIYVRTTLKGQGLTVRFKSGRCKDLTMSLGSGAGLEGVAAALNLFLNTRQ
jgi:hypothetical protein